MDLKKAIATIYSLLSSLKMKQSVWRKKPVAQAIDLGSALNLTF